MLHHDRTVAGLRVAEHVVGDAVIGARLPLVIALHGRGGEPGLPDLRYASGAVRVLVPHGPHALAGARAWSPISVTSGRADALAEDLARSAALLDAMIAEHEAERPVLGTPILAGYSQGAMVAFALAARATRKWELVLGASWAPPSIEAALTIEAIAHLRAAHGEADDIVTLPPTRQLFERLRSRGIDAQLRTFTGVTHLATPAMEEQLSHWLADAIDRARRPEGPA